MSGMTSTGRGGAGNIADATKSPRLAPSDLETPTLKTSVVTTGRGGSGNMAPNLDPVETRARQDVGPIERRPSTGATHVGRGGAANFIKPSSPEPKPESNNNNNNKPNDNTQAESAIADDASSSGSNDKKQPGKTGTGIVSKAKDFFKLT
ncbi:hypothetical protein F4777DRAFT_348072 [Nemania sp. FL0916]|nr:hypothetical protein F4777DRAFT_348072 [Nemania sp. FL0916]